MKIIIARHGQTKWNEEGRLQGNIDIPVSRIGLNQARMLANHLENVKIDIIYTSRLKRAIRTAQEISKFHQAKMVKTKELNEMSWGILEGMKMQHVKIKYPEIFNKREDDKFNYKLPKGESPLIIKKRLVKFVNKIKRKHKDKAVLVVGHGGINRVLMGILLNWSSQRILRTRLHNTGVTIIKLSKNKARMLLFDSKKHLENGKLQS